MSATTFEAVADLLNTKFDVPRENIQLQAELQSLGLDSLMLMEFVFAVEDEFAVRIPEESLDPRQAHLTLADLCRVLDGCQAPGATLAAAA